jgi:hypothetical protein
MPSEYRHQRSRARAATRSYRNAVGLRPVDEVRDDEEVARESHLDDGLRLEFEPVAVARPRLVALRALRIEGLQPLLEARSGLRAQVVLDGFAVRRGEIRQAALAQRELEGAAPGDLHGVLECSGQICEELRHLHLCLEVLRGVEFLRAAAVAQHIALRNAHACVVRAVVLAPHELDRVRRDDGKPGRRGELDRGLHERRALHRVHALDFHVEGARKIPRPAACDLEGLLAIAGQECQAHVTALRTRQDDEALQARKPFALELRPAAPVVLGMGARKQRAKREIAVVVAREQRHPVGGVAVALVGDPHVAADDRLDARLRAAW